ncbi:uncharacterized protein LOC127161163 [Labeo rohita]|uniref:uncharacterized protein LOC127161163 n=1 Tax=Labeo rohita TaxID=84645 RepID=UPI0021E2E792|nr:uncharacterized protein LOC127161163 [Labeo rohita]
MKLLVVLASACVLLHRGVFGVEEITLFVVQGDFVSLHTGVKTNQQDRIRWYFNDIRLAQITGILCKTCTDVHCDKIFRDRLELDNQTGSLTITSIMTSDAGLYKLKILDSPSSEKIFNVTVHDQQKTVPVKERKVVTLYTGVVNPDDLMTWYFNDILITEINGHPNETHKERFRDRLQLDNQTGSLTITSTRTTDSGLYKLQINSSSSSIIRNFNVAVFDSHVETPAQDLILHDMKAVFVGAVLSTLTIAVALGVTFCLCKSHETKQKCSTKNRRNDSDESGTILL